ncbi:hypothetical protein AWH56_009055 [Anaerobacillus isosaccharinicus]|uniref:Uncharacterized protein n=1 Tax=Anaerobacillus isosaccharinicus TaxID=1532552 RepID=A0A1S2MCU9_9BACI|nr:hypothetical protein [Anaerobacillus isosaccharinicus]MBA5588900.1 hypothetical protein [Anaerobacillus isosaccharinicus]QOY37710.1 hypothetical protein AWH56_009055 [Anaerobacillus isosaccharinicus]
MYKPAVQYDDTYRTFVSEISKATTLDRQQIIRAALFVAGQSKEYQRILKAHLKENETLPTPDWNKTDHDLWLEQPGGTKKEENNNGHNKKVSTIQDNETNEIREVSNEELSTKHIFKQQGGIKLKIG